MSNLLEKHKTKEDYAVFKFGIIAPLINDTTEYKSKESFFKITANQEYTLPNGKKAKFSNTTIKSWYSSYIKFGLEGLKTKDRKDFGQSRTLSSQISSEVESIQQKYPYITGKAIYNKLVENGNIKASEVSLSSLYRFLKVNKLEPKTVTDRRAFEFEFANDCWQRRYISRS